MNKMKKGLILASAIFFCISGIFASSNEKGIDLYRAELYDAAKIFFLQQTNQSRVEQAENYYYLGQTYYRLQQNDSAAYFYNKAIEVDPEYSFGYIGQGMMALTSNDAKGADALFKKAIGLAKKDPSVQTSIAEVYIAVEMYPQAEEALDRARRIDRRYSGIFVAEGDMLMQQGKVGDACGRYENAINFNQTDKVAYLNIARVYKTINAEQSLNYLNRLIAIDPNYIPAYAELGDIYRQDGKYLQALDAYKKFISIPGVPILQHERYAQLLYFTDQYAESLEEIEYVLTQNPSNAVMLRLKGYNNFKLENYELAAEQLNSFIQNNPVEDIIYLDYIMLGRAQIKEKQVEGAISNLLKAAEKDSSKSEVFKELVNAYELAGNYSEAVKMYEKFFEIEPTPVVIDFFNYGQTNFYAAAQYTTPGVLNAILTPEEQAANDAELQSYIERGNGAYAEVISRSPESFLGYYHKARLNSLLDAVEQTRTGKTSGNAKLYYEEAIQMMVEKYDAGTRNRELLEAYRYLASYYYVLGDKENASEYYKKMLEIDPDNEGAKQVLDYMKVKY